MRRTSTRELISIEMVSSLNVSVINSRVVNFKSHSYLVSSSSSFRPLPAELAMDADSFLSSHEVALSKHDGISSDLQDCMILQDFELVDYMTDTQGLNHHGSGDSKLTSVLNNSSYPLGSPYNPTPLEWSSDSSEAFFDMKGWADGCGVERSQQNVASFEPSPTNGAGWNLDRWNLLGTPEDSRFTVEHTVRQAAWPRLPCQGPSVASNGALKVDRAKELRPDLAVSKEPTIYPSNNCFVSGCSREKKPFERQDQLKRHLREIHGEAKFVCESCNKRFTRRYGFRHHLKKIRQCRNAQESQDAKEREKRENYPAGG